MMMPVQKPRSVQLNMRIPAEIKEQLQDAAWQERKSLTRFLLDRALRPLDREVTA
jgi:uncharacterized protein (DUF1778 family)